MIHPLKIVRSSIAVTLDAVGEILSTVESTLRAAQKAVDRFAGRLDPGEEYGRPVKPTAWGRDDYWQGDDFAAAFDLIERTRDIRDAGPK